MNFANEREFVSRNSNCSQKLFMPFPMYFSCFLCGGDCVGALFDCQLTQSFGGEGLYGELLFQSSPAQPGFSLSADGKVILTYLKPSSWDRFATGVCVNDW